jgi:putative transposase
VRERGSPSTNPDQAWVVQQARTTASFFAEQPVKPRYLLRDRDTKFVAEFDAILESEGLEVVKVAVRAPNQNAVAERFVQTVKSEVLDHFIVCSEKHLRHLLSEFLAHYHEERPHQGLGNVPLGGVPPPVEEPAVLPLSAVRCRERLGGLLKHYRRAA